jgi:hypothetical protein
MDQRNMSTKLVTQFNHDDVHFHAVTFNAKGQKNVDMSYDKTSTSWANKVVLQLSTDTEPIISKWPLSQPREGEDGKRRSWELNIKDKETLSVLEKLDKCVLDKACEKSREWFKKDLKREQVEARFKQIVKEPTNEGDYPTIMIKVKCPPNENPTKIMKILEDGVTLEPGTIDDLTKDAEVIAVVRTNGVWFMSDSFGVSFQADKIMVKPVPKKTFEDHFVLSKEFKMQDVSKVTENDKDEEEVMELEEGE